MPRFSSVIAFIVAFIASCEAFMGPASRFGASLTMKMDMPKVLAGMAPAAIAAPAFASTDLATSMPLSLEVTFAAYLAVLLGTFIPVTFLIVLYTQSEARKAGARSGN